MALYKLAPFCRADLSGSCCWCMPIPAVPQSEFPPLATCSAICLLRCQWCYDVPAGAFIHPGHRSQLPAGDRGERRCHLHGPEHSAHTLTDLPCICYLRVVHSVPCTPGAPCTPLEPPGWPSSATPPRCAAYVQTSLHTSSSHTGMPLPHTASSPAGPDPAMGKAYHPFDDGACMSRWRMRPYERTGSF